jgi:hypothetical protein
MYFEPFQGEKKISLTENTTLIELQFDYLTNTLKSIFPTLSHNNNHEEIKIILKDNQKDVVEFVVAIFECKRILDKKYCNYDDLKSNLINALNKINSIDIKDDSTVKNKTNALKQLIDPLESALSFTKTIISAERTQDLIDDSFLSDMKLPPLLNTPNGSMHFDEFINFQLSECV